MTDAYNQYFVNDIEHTENNKRAKSAKYHLFLSLDKLLSTSAWSSLSYLIISAGRTA